MLSGSLSCLFNVRLCNFKATGLQNAAGGAPPYCLRGNFDGRAFNSEYFHSATMAPIWALDQSFEYQSGTVESLRTKFLVLECYGGDRFLGMSRVDLFTLATGPVQCELSIKEGPKMNGVLAFECSFQQVTSISLHLTRLTLRNIATRGYEGAPNPYLSYGLSTTGNDLESAVAANADNPQWERLPAMHCRGTFQHLNDQRVKIDVKHSRNGCTAGINDPTMASFEVALSGLPVDFGRDSAIPFREMVHSLPSYQYPFSSECTGLLEIKNMPQVVQMKGGILTDEGVVGGIPASAQGAAGNQGSALNTTGLESPSQRGIGMATTSASIISQRQPPPQVQPTPATPPPPAAVVATSMANVTSSHNASHMGGSYIPPQSSMISPTKQQQQQQPFTTASSLMGVSALPNATANITATNTTSTHLEAVSTFANAKAHDVEMLQEVSDKQQNLLNTVQERLRQLHRRRTELTQEISNSKMKEEEELEVSTKRRQHLEGDMKAALSERERLEGVLRTVAIRREQELQNSQQLAAERERARRAVEDEQQEVNILQERVNHLRAEMTRHLEEEELRYAQRVREAEEAKRRAQRDAEDLAALEAKLVSAETRARKSFSEGQGLSTTTTTTTAGNSYRGLSPSRRHH